MDHDDDFTYMCDEVVCLLSSCNSVCQLIFETILALSFLVATSGDKCYLQPIFVSDCTLNLEEDLCIAGTLFFFAASCTAPVKLYEKYFLSPIYLLYILLQIF